jgi:hypothetical protein
MVNVKGILVATSICAALSGCYVVPVQPYTAASNNQSYATAVAPVPAVRPVYTARLYPVNDSASSMGRISGTISNPERGHGEFSFTVKNETYVGEATRLVNASKGSANASGNRGGFVKCDYTMTGAGLGTGTCIFSSGARYDMHISL